MRISLINLPASVPGLMYVPRIRRAYTEIGQVLPNLSLLYLAAWLRKNGHEVSYIEAFALRMNLAEIVREIKIIQPDLLGFNLITETFESSMKWIEKIKNAVKLPVIAGGTHMRFFAKETLTHSSIDYVATGEGWFTFLELLETLEGKKNISGIPGIGYRREGNVTINPPRKETLSLEQAPLPARDLIPNDAYTTLLSRRWPVTVALSSSGCSHRCLYCDIGALPLSFRSAGSMLAEIRECHERFGIREIHYQDETFTLKRERVLEFCSGLEKEKLPVKFSIRTRPDALDEELLRRLARAGCYKVHLGIESGDEKVLKNLGREAPLHKTKEAVFLCRKYGILTLGFVMVGNPGEKYPELRRTLALLKSLPLDFIQVNKFVPTPLSPLYERYRTARKRDPWRNYVSGDYAALEELRSSFSSFSPVELDRWQKHFFRKFYFRPAFVLRRIGKLKNFRELAGYLRAAGSLL